MTKVNNKQKNHSPAPARDSASARAATARDSTTFARSSPPLYHIASSIQTHHPRPSACGGHFASALDDSSSAARARTCRCLWNWRDRCRCTWWRLGLNTLYLLFYYFWYYLWLIMSFSLLLVRVRWDGSKLNFEMKSLEKQSKAESIPKCARQRDPTKEKKVVAEKCFYNSKHEKVHYTSTYWTMFIYKFINLWFRFRTDRDREKTLRTEKILIDVTPTYFYFYYACPSDTNWYPRSLSIVFHTSHIKLFYYKYSVKLKSLMKK